MNTACSVAPVRNIVLRDRWLWFLIVLAIAPLGASLQGAISLPGSDDDGANVIKPGITVSKPKKDHDTPENQKTEPPAKPLDQKGVLSLIVDLRDGSKLIGQTKIETLPLKTSYASLQIPIKLITSIHFGETNQTATVVTQSGDKLQGTVELKTFKLDTILGSIVVPMDQVMQISMVMVDKAGSSSKTFKDQDDTIRIPGNSTLISTRTHEHLRKLPQPIRSSTWMFWIRTTQAMSGTIISKDTVGIDPHDFYLNLNDTFPDRPRKLTWVEGTASGDFKWPTARDINDGEWHHVAIVRDFDRKILRFHLDGNAETSQQVSNMWEINNDQPLQIGQNFRGELRDVRFMPEALGGEDIHRMMHHEALPVEGYSVDLDQTK